jgi:hypothetical protein
MTKPQPQHLDWRKADLVWRGLDRFSRDNPRLARELKLPDWTCSCRLA